MERAIVTLHTVAASSSLARGKKPNFERPECRMSGGHTSRLSCVPGTTGHQNLYLKVFPVRVAISKGSKVTFARVNDPVPVPGTACTGFVACGISREIAGNGMRGFQPDDSPETRCVK